MKIEAIYRVPVGPVRDKLKAVVIHATHRGRHILRASFAGRRKRERFRKCPTKVAVLGIADECSLLPYL